MRLKTLVFGFFCFCLVQCKNDFIIKKDGFSNLRIEYSNDSVYFYYNNEYVFSDYNNRIKSRDPKENVVLAYDTLNKNLYFFNYDKGIYQITLDETEKIINKKLPYQWYAKSLGDSIVLHKNKILYLSKLYSVIYDKNLNEKMLPYEYMSSYENNKYEQILEVYYFIRNEDLFANIRYLENYEQEKDTTFTFKLNY